MKLARAAILVLGLPLGLAAQQTPASPPVDPITTTFRNRTLGLQRNLMQAFDSIPASKFNYRPTPAQLTIGYVAQHVADDNYFFCSSFGDMKPTRPAADTSTPDSVKATWPRETLVTKLHESMDFCEGALKQLTDAKLADQITINPPGGAPRTLSRAVMVLGHVIDLADHYSQIANYMRLNNMIPPSALPRPRSGQ
jgi:uncharacterized damage-inducible protein DinB